MRLYVIRHGQAEVASPTGLDQDRPLTRVGLEQAGWLAERLAAAPVPPSLVLISGAVRTRQTAGPIVAAVGCPMEVCDWLWLGVGARRVVELLGEHAGIASLALVGHNPQLEQVVSILVGGEPAPADHLSTGRAIELAFDGAAAAGGGRVVGSMRMD